MKIFENASFFLTKTEVFEYDDFTPHIPLAWLMLHKGCYGISIVLAFSVWTSENDSNTLRGRAFLENGGKKNCFFFFFFFLKIRVKEA